MLIPGGRDRRRIDSLLHPTVCFVPQQRVQMPELQHVAATAGPSCLGLVTQQVSRWTQLRCCGAAQTGVCACITTGSSPRSAAVRHSSPVRQTLAPAVGERCFSLFQPPVTHAELVHASSTAILPLADCFSDPHRLRRSSITLPCHQGLGGMRNARSPILSAESRADRCNAAYLSSQHRFGVSGWGNVAGLTGVIHHITFFQRK